MTLMISCLNIIFTCAIVWPSPIDLMLSSGMAFSIFFVVCLGIPQFRYAGPQIFIWLSWTTLLSFSFYLFFLIPLHNIERHLQNIYFIWAIMVVAIFKADMLISKILSLCASSKTNITVMTTDSEPLFGICMLMMVNQWWKKQTMFYLGPPPRPGLHEKRLNAPSSWPSSTDLQMQILPCIAQLCWLSDVQMCKHFVISFISPSSCPLLCMLRFSPELSE